MKKKIITTIFMIAIATVAAWNVNQTRNDVALSDLSLSNVEALAQSEHLSPGYAHVSHPSFRVAVCTGKGGLYCI